VVEKMADEIGKQNKPASQTDLPDADAADEFAKLRGNNLSHVNNSGPQPRRVSLSKNS
jgi:hypothetical protein